MPKVDVTDHGLDSHTICARAAAAADAGGGGMTRRVLIRSSLLGTLLVISAWQPSTASARPAKEALGRVEAEQKKDGFAQCTISSRSRRVRVERFVRMPLSSPDFAKLANGLASEACVPRDMRGQVEMRFQPDLLRAALFSAMYRRDYGKAPGPDVSAVPALTVTTEFDGSEKDIPEAMYFMRGLGDCVARRDATKVHALLLTEVGVDAERSVFVALQPALANCLPEKRELRFSRSMLRGVLAEGLYKLRIAASPCIVISPADQKSVVR